MSECRHSGVPSLVLGPWSSSVFVGLWRLQIKALPPFNCPRSPVVPLAPIVSGSRSGFYTEVRRPRRRKGRKTKWRPGLSLRERKTRSHRHHRSRALACSLRSPALTAYDGLQGTYKASFTDKDQASTEFNFKWRFSKHYSV